MTANLDGETSLKTRLSAQLTKQAKQIKMLVSLYGCIECENPNPKLDSFLGRLTVWSCKEGDETEVNDVVMKLFQQDPMQWSYDAIVTSIGFNSSYLSIVI